ncbi:hypothetical protein Q4F19_07275 [Sphingomonas sp. BIUV-7]|uniref:Uncharacterized protein n=1 Tax=Sphingomonas natans TaxID=3063330 RepID=A0ABT8Y8H0_9SPHN|nr:hypothetical protein [Sphingomonas sp. BIUV-7]MDO6414178.1 hypothetical protein [Sphingomonas sp. BIUV-7]
MSEFISNDNHRSLDGRRRIEDPHGEAAILLVESLIHSLIARRVLSFAEAIEIVDIAGDAKREIAADVGESAAEIQTLTILDAIRATLSIDLAGDERSKPLVI